MARLFNIIKEFIVKHKRYVPCVIYILLLIASTINVSFQGGAFSYVFFYVVLLYLPLSLIYLTVSMLMLEVYQETDNRILYKGTAEKYQFVVENTSIIPVSGIKFFYDASIAGFVNDFTTETFRFLPKEKHRINTEIICHYAGAYDAGVEGYYLQDMFGILRIKRKVKIPIRVHVLPVITDIAHRDIMELGDISSSGNLFSLAQRENYLGNDIRKYAPGDSLNTVHWKNYARTGEMFVRLPDNQQTEMICLALVTELMDGSIENIERRDKYLEYIVSVGEFFGMSKRPLLVAYYDKEVKTIVVDSPQSFQEFYLERIPRIGNKHSAGREEEVLKEISGRYGSVIMFRESEGILER